MLDIEPTKRSQNIEQKVQSAFQTQDPDPLFITRLQNELVSRFSNYTIPTGEQTPATRHSKFFTRLHLAISPLTWGLISLIFILTLIWGINTLIPRSVPGGTIRSTPSPLTSPSPWEPTQIAPSLKNAVFYTVQAGDTLAIIENKTGVSVKTIQDLNVFVLQANDLVAGLKLLIGFKGQAPLFYKVQENDTVVSISDITNISIEDFALLNRLESPGQGTENSALVSKYKLTPGIRVIVGLENLNSSENEGLDNHLIIISEMDLDCDSREERILGIEAPEIQYFNIKPQLSAIILEDRSGTQFKKVWQLTSQDTGSAYLAYQFFHAEGCNQFLVVLSHKGKEAVHVFHWDGEHMTSVMNLSGKFLFEGNWMMDVFGDYQKSPNTLYIGELQQPTSSAKNIWILRGYQWVDDEFKMVIERQVETNAGG